MWPVNKLCNDIRSRFRPFRSSNHSAIFTWQYSIKSATTNSLLFLFASPWTIESISVKLFRLRNFHFSSTFRNSITFNLLSVCLRAVFSIFTNSYPKRPLFFSGCVFTQKVMTSLICLLLILWSSIDTCLGYVPLHLFDIYNNNHNRPIAFFKRRQL